MAKSKKFCDQFNELFIRFFALYKWNASLKKTASFLKKIENLIRAAINKKFCCWALFAFKDVDLILLHPNDSRANV